MDIYTPSIGSLDPTYVPLFIGLHWFSSVGAPKRNSKTFGGIFFRAEAARVDVKRNFMEFCT